MRPIFFFLLTLAYSVSSAQNQAKDFLEKDSLIIVAKNPKKGFYHEYILFIPKKTPLYKKTFLLVEPNNTGKISDDIAVHKKYAIDLASVSSVGNNVSTELRLPLLVPVFPRPESDSLMYTHALDRDVIVQKSRELKRLDLQLLHMIDDAKRMLISMDIPVESKVFMNGFSASATFTNRFSFLHPDKIKALAIGGFNGELMLPNKTINGVKLDYPIGTNDFQKLFGKNFELNTYKTIPQLIYMGKLDDNDAVQYDDAYSEKERAIINDNIGKEVQPRYLTCQKIYRENGITPTFKTFENVGHWTTADVNLEVIKFFYKQMLEK